MLYFFVNSQNDLERQQDFPFLLDVRSELEHARKLLMSKDATNYSAKQTKETFQYSV